MSKKRKCKYGYSADSCELGFPGCACADDWMVAWAEAGYPSDDEGNPKPETEWPNATDHPTQGESNG